MNWQQWLLVAEVVISAGFVFLWMDVGKEWISAGESVFWGAWDLGAIWILFGAAGGHYGWQFFTVLGMYSYGVAIAIYGTVAGGKKIGLEVSLTAIFLLALFAAGKIWLITGVA